MADHSAVICSCYTINKYAFWTIETEETIKMQCRFLKSQPREGWHFKEPKKGENLHFQGNDN